VRRDAVEEPAVVGDDHGAAGKVQQRLLERPERIDVEVVRGLVEQEQVAAAASAAWPGGRGCARRRQDADLLLLVAALEAEPPQ
jgi:hypothetical protein